MLRLSAISLPRLRPHRRRLMGRDADALWWQGPDQWSGAGSPTKDPPPSDTPRWRWQRSRQAASPQSGRRCSCPLAHVQPGRRPMRVEGQPAASASAALALLYEAPLPTKWTTIASANIASKTSRCAARLANSLQSVRHWCSRRCGLSARGPPAKCEPCASASVPNSMAAKLRVHAAGSTNSRRPIEAVEASPPPLREPVPRSADAALLRNSAIRRCNLATSFSTNELNFSASPQPAKSG
mmetsp:Transcript_90504/g.255491  ORF Transcript_90504/g.255491 Transcript_90504/m.255491 type:complete len:240 (-) Transcript_90504:414-1133(-)